MNRIDQVRKIHPEYVDVALTLANEDHNNKYLLWIAAQLANKHSKEDIISTVEAFHKDTKRLAKADIYAYKDLKELEDEIKKLGQSKRQYETILKEEGSSKIYEDDRFTVYRIDSKHAIMHYGRESQWCITQEKQSYWENYNWEGNSFYIILNRKGSSTKKNKGIREGSKYAVQKTGFINLTVWDVNDYPLELEDWISDHPEFEKPCLACLQDSTPSMWKKIRDRTATQEEVKTWLTYQHSYTVDFIRAKAPFYVVNFDDDITKIISIIKNISFNDFNTIIRMKASFGDDLVDFLTKASKKKGYKKLRVHLAKIYPDKAPKFLLEEQLVEYKIKSNPDAIQSLLQSTDSNVWKKALKQAKPKDILSVFPETRRIKRKMFQDCLNSFMKVFGNTGPIWDWMVQALQKGDIELPKKMRS